jgi:antitoxin component YwqK of YwqJK toxin-antitoxin module
MDQLENQKVYQDKVLIAEFNFSNGNMNGTQTIWDNKGKNLIIQENYKDGNYNGSQKKWFENGQLEREENYIDGKKTGWQRYYDTSGKLLGESNLIDGTGKISVKYANGQRAFEESYLNGEPDGLQKSWYKNGQITAEYNFVSGKRVGLQTAYSEKGEIVEEGNLIDGNGIIKENINIDNDTMFWEYNQGILYGPITALYDGNIKYDKGNISAVNFSYDGFHYNVNINGSILNIDRKTEPDNEYSDDPTLQKTSIFIYDRFQLIDFSWDELLYYSRTVSKYLKNCFIIKHECYNSFDQLIHCRY